MRRRRILFSALSFQSSPPPCPTNAHSVWAARKDVTACTSERVGPPLAGADAHDGLHRADPHLAVTDFAGSSGLDDHLDRLLDGARKLRLDAGMSKAELADITKRCVAMSQLRESFVNLTVTRGYGKRKGEKDLSKLTHQVYIYAIPYLWAFPPAEQIFGTTAIVPRHVRRAGRNTVDPTIKNYQWGDLTAASFEAKDRGARTAILMDSDNCVAEGPGFNVVIVKDGKLASPSRNALPGITRKTVFEIADQMGIEATLRDVTSHELYDADELMAVTTAGGVTPINSLDGEPIGDGTPGPLTVAIRDRFWALMDEPSPLIEAIEY